MIRALLAVPTAVLLLAAAPADLAGRYALSGVREAAGGLELLADGRFRYGLSYGALDEQAEGRWRLEANRVLLTTDPPPRPPEFRLADARPGDPGVLRIRLDNPAGQGIANIEVTAILADGTREQAQTTTDWLEAPLDKDHRPRAIQFHIPVFDIASPEMPVDVAVAQSFRFVLDPKDLGVRDFRDWPLDIRGDLLAPPGAPEGQGFRRLRED